jgi:FkbM family methyltransferase
MLGRLFLHWLRRRLRNRKADALTVVSCKIAHRVVRFGKLKGKIPLMFGAEMELNGENSIDFFLIVYGVWEPALTHYLVHCLKRGRTFVDIGANVGYFSLLASQMMGKSAKVIAVEASPEIFRKLSDNLSLNKASVRAVNFAALDRECEVEIVAGPKGNLGGTSIAVSSHSGEKILAKTVPPMLTPCELKGLQFIKIDVEGAEPAVVRGLIPAIEKAPLDLELAIEVSPAMSQTLRMDAMEMVNTLMKLGFTPYVLRNDVHPIVYRPTSGFGWKLFDGVIGARADMIFTRKSENEFAGVFHRAKVSDLYGALSKTAPIL